MGLGEATGTVSLINKAIDKRTKSGARIDYRRGVAVTGGSYQVSAYLEGNTDGTEDFITVPAGSYVNPGDYLLVGMDARGLSWVEQIQPYSLYSKMALDYNNKQILLGNGTEEPVIGSEGQIIGWGEAGVEWIDAAAALASVTERKSFTTVNSLDAGDGQWAKIADGQIVSRFGYVSAIVLLGGGGSNGATWTRGTLRFRIRQQAEYDNQPIVTMELVDASDISVSDFVIRIGSVVGPTTYQVYARIEREYEWISLTPLWYDTYSTDHLWVACEPLVPFIPTGGTNYTATPPPGGAIIQTKRVLSVSIAEGTSEQTLIMWDTPFLDMNYTITATPEGGSGCVMNIVSGTKTTSSVEISVMNLGGAPRAPILNVVAIHD